MTASESLTTPRLHLRRPRAEDAPAIFRAYSSDPQVTRFLSWPRHLEVEQTRAFIQASDQEWQRWPVGPYLIELESSHEIIGGTGLNFETPERATTGYVLAERTWGHGFASEALGAVLAQAEQTGLRRITATCHAKNAASVRVLEKADFRLERTMQRHTLFPNLGETSPSDVLLYAKRLRG